MCFPEEYYVAQARTLFDFSGCINRVLAETIIILALLEFIASWGKLWLVDQHQYRISTEMILCIEVKTKISENYVGR